MTLKYEFMEDEILSGVVVTVYAAVTNTDLTEGRGIQVDHSYYHTRADALMGASKIGVMGSDGKVKPRFALHLSDDRYILLPTDAIKISENPDKVARLREQALSKLTEAEKVALLGE